MTAATDSLIRKALTRSTKARAPKKVTDAQMELSLAWLEGRLSLSQVEHALETRNTLHRLSLYLRAAYRDGRLKVMR